MNKALLTILVIAVLGFVGWLIFGETETSSTTVVPDVEEVVDIQEDLKPSATSTEPEETATSNESDASDVQVFDVSGSNFAFDPAEMRVTEGDTVVVNLTSVEGFHDWVIDEFAAATERINAGETTSVTFVADRAGTYEYYCSVGSHRAQGMVGTLVVEPAS